ncbi:MAG TPA: RICIN domain-containing protein [Jatrophihabitans sp.]|nr:RICIN domain-containing protein [Jatrophihabitans sp.]
MRPHEPLAHWLRRRWARLHDDRGSLPLAMLVMLVGLGLTAALAPTAIVQRRATTFDATRIHALDAAQSGVDVMIGMIRNATGSNGGDPTQLPCTLDTHTGVTTPVTGPVDNGSSSYSVTVQYYVSDPVAHPGAVPMLCVAGSGTFDQASGSIVPSYAKITSAGTDNAITPDGGTAGRTITSIYAFNVDNTNISGGIVRIYPASSDGATQWCLDVGSGTPTDGVTQVSLQQCSTSFPPAPQQVFAYRTDLTLQLVNSIGTVVNGVTYRNGLCIDDTSFGSGSPANGTTLVLRQCGALGSPVWSQQWSFDSYSSLQAPRSNSGSTGTLSGLCMSAASHAANVAVRLGGCDRNINSATDAWIPSPAVGAGAAAAPTSHQWINFQQFGRCINVPGSDPREIYVIVPTCKQNPLQSAIDDNQKFYYDPVHSWFYTNLSGTNYCLFSTNTAYEQDGTVGRVMSTPCFTGSSHYWSGNGIAVSQSQLQWTHTTPATDSNYSKQYRFIDSSGLCLSVANMPNVPGALYGSNYSVWPKLVTATCDFSTLQQWNASNDVGNSSVMNIREN